MNNWRSLITLDMTFKVLIGLQLLTGLFLIIFTDIGRGLGLFGIAALIYLGMQVTEHLTSLRELLTYSLFKQGNPQEDTLSYASHMQGAPAREPTIQGTPQGTLQGTPPREVPERMPRSVRSAAATDGDELRRGT